MKLKPFILDDGAFFSLVDAFPKKLEARHKLRIGAPHQKEANHTANSDDEEYRIHIHHDFLSSAEPASEETGSGFLTMKTTRRFLERQASRSSSGARGRDLFSP